MTEADRNFGIGLHLSQDCFMGPSILLVCGIYGSAFIIFVGFVVACFLIRYFWLGHVQYLSIEHPEYITKNTKRIHYFFSILYLIYICIYICIGDEKNKDFFGIDMAYFLLVPTVLVCLLSAAAYSYLFTHMIPSEEG